MSSARAWCLTATVVALAAAPSAASAQVFRYCYSYDLPNCTTVTLTVTPPAPGTPPYYPGFPPATLLSAHFVHYVQQLTVNDPTLGTIYLGPYRLSNAYYHPLFYPGGGGFYPGFIDDAPWLWGGTGMNTEGTYILDDVHPIIGPGSIYGLVATGPSGTVVFSRVSTTTTPEPGTVGLALTGLLGIAIAARRRRA